MPKESERQKRRSNRRQYVKVDNNNKENSAKRRKSSSGSGRHSPLQGKSSKRRELTLEKQKATMTSTELLHTISGGIIGSGIKYMMFPLNLLRSSLFGTTKVSRKLIFCKDDKESKDSGSSFKKINREEKESKSSKSKGDRDSRSDEASSSRRSPEESRKSTRPDSLTDTKDIESSQKGHEEKSLVVALKENFDSPVDQWSTVRNTVTENVFMEIEKFVTIDSVEPMDISIEEHTCEESLIMTESCDQMQTSTLSVEDEIAEMFQKQCTSSEEENSFSHSLTSSEKREKTGGENFLCRARTGLAVAVPSTLKEEKEWKMITSAEDENSFSHSLTSSEKREKTGGENFLCRARTGLAGAVPSILKEEKEWKMITSAEDENSFSHSLTSSEKREKTGGENFLCRARTGLADAVRSTLKEEKEWKMITSAEDENSFSRSLTSSEKREKTGGENFLCRARTGLAVAVPSILKEEKEEMEWKKNTSDEDVAHNKRRKVSQVEDKPEKQEDGKSDAKRREEKHSSKQDGPSKSKTRSPRSPMNSNKSKRKDVHYKEIAIQTDSAFSDDDVVMTSVDIKLPQKRFSGKRLAHRSHPNLRLCWGAEQDSNDYVADNEDSNDGFMSIARKRVSLCSTSSSSSDLGFDEHGSPPNSDVGTVHDTITSYRKCNRAPPGFPKQPQNPPLSYTHTGWYNVATTPLENNPCGVLSVPTVVPRAPSPMRHLYYNYPEFMDLPGTANSQVASNVRNDYNQ